jgi:membrane fusion protein, multidrug efflux system
MSTLMEEEPLTVRSPEDGNGNAATGNGGNGKTADVEKSAGKSKRSNRVLAIVGIVTIVLTIAGVAYWLNARHFESTDDAFIDGHVVTISPQVSALVSAVHVNDNQFVHKGDLLVELDQTDFLVALNQARGSEAAANGKLEQARASIEAANSEVAEAQANLDSAQATHDNALRELKRYTSLDVQARSQEQLDNATSNEKTTAAAVEEAQAKLRSAQSDVVTAQADVVAAVGDYQKAQADTHRAEVNLGYCQIVAPADGRITNKSVEAGAYVTSANPLFQIVPPEVWVIANFKETQLQYMQPGQSATISIDSFPDLQLHGKVDSIQAGTGSRFSIIPAENATGNFVKVVQRVPVKILFDEDANSDPNHLLSPGMSVEAEVHVH